MKKEKEINIKSFSIKKNISNTYNNEDTDK